MKFLLDTDMCVYWLRGQSAVREYALMIDPADLAISIITLAELYYGAAWSAQPIATKRAVEVFADAITVLPLNPASVEIFGNVKATLRKQGQRIEDLDLLIAATALAHGVVLVTNNQQHFRRIPDLQLANWLTAE